MKRAKNNWPPEHLAELLRLSYGKGSAERIAEKLSATFGVPRSANAVCGKIFRLRLAGEKVGPHWRPGARRPKSGKGRLRGQGAANGKHAAPAAPAAELAAPAPAADGEAAPIHFIDRQHGQCAYPLWGNAERLGNVCGKPVDAASPFQFCSGHAACCLVAVRERRRE